jgi:lipopolysaccharide/colanic/teichoic acid biosynthesis glycosyltransferase
MLKRTFDFIFSFFGLLVLSPVFLIIALIILTESRGGAFYFQVRVGLHKKPFTIFKFRTMFVNADKIGLLTIGMKDKRITKSGCFIRKYKLDELPQLFNVLIGDMSFVGPRPEVQKYVNLYSDLQLKVFTVKPGITDFASLKFSKENEILGRAKDPEAVYIREIMPLKLELNLKYIEERSFLTDLKIIFKTISGIVKT